MNNRVFLFIAITVLVFALSPLAIDMSLPALPEMARHLNATHSQMEMSLAVFLLAFAIAQPLFGLLADRYHKLNLLLTGLVIFTLSSLAIPMLDSATGLYIARIFQAIGGASSVVCFAMIQQQYDKQKGARVLTYVMAAVVAAPLLAPVIGGQILKHASWQWVFYTLGATGIFAFVASLLTHTQADKVESGGEQLQRRRAASISDFIQVFKQPLPLAYILLGSFGFAGLFSFVAGSPYVFMNYFSVSAEHYSYLLGGNALGVIIGSLVSVKLLGQIAPKAKAIVAGTLLGPLSLLFFMLAQMDAPLSTIVVTVFIFNLLLGFISANAITAAISFFPAQGGAVSGVFGFSQFALGALFSAAISLSDAQSPVALLTFMGLACACAAIFSTYIYTNTPACEEGEQGGEEARMPVQ
ncbi:Bcr/CflA family efflux MFS transporter [uncultured Shewanella sp.]|uniref:Bcr/CflA family efflux MFS transporter n=1 Tax=Shewanella atlantica TaxID=271099 RepID=UPI002614F0A0|nr:Bcr/CflA family efflux MFS transporter [uncultured Shewanella sp.]